MSATAERGFEFATPAEFCAEVRISYAMFKTLAKQRRIPGLIRHGRNVQRVHMPTYLEAAKKGAK